MRRKQLTTSVRSPSYSPIQLCVSGVIEGKIGTDDACETIFMVYAAGASKTDVFLGRNNYYGQTPTLRVKRSARTLRYA